MILMAPLWALRPPGTASLSDVTPFAHLRLLV